MKKSILYGPTTRLLLTGGGTGGHVVPAIELAKAHSSLSEGAILYVGSPGSLEERLSKSEKVPFLPVPSGGFVGKSFLGKLKSIVKITTGIGRARGILQQMRPDLVIGTGGYVQIPVVAAALLMRIPVILLEPNEVMGLANRFFRPWAIRVVRADGSGQLRGIPVSDEVCGPPPSRERFSGGSTRIMVLGGSQGARSLNEKLPGILGKVLSGMPERKVEILHQSGDRWLESTTKRYAALGLDARVEGFIPGLASRFREQTLIIARAGAMTVAEISASGTPAIYIPFPFSAGGHQEKNARGVENRGAGRFWAEHSLEDVDERARELLKMLVDPDGLHAMAERSWQGSTAVSARSWLQALGEFKKDKHD